MSNFDSVLVLQKMVFDNIEFKRKGFKNDHEITFKLAVQMGKNEENDYKITVILNAQKLDEYDITISLTGFFTINDINKLDEKFVNDLISKNAVAILMPYLRAELTLLTAQPDTDSIVLPPFNINKMMDKTN